MEKAKNNKRYNVKESIFDFFLNKYWFIPSDVLQRSLEANIWNLHKFKNPILDIGIGNGQLTNFLFRNHPQFEVGIDIEKKGLRMAEALEMSRGKKRYRKVLWANAEEMPFKNNSFNTVVSNSTFEHIKNDFKAVSEVSRVLKKEGLLFVTVPSKYLQEWIMEQNKEIDKFNKRANHLHYRSLKNWKKYFENNGLKLVTYKYYLPKDPAILWYKLFELFTHKFGKRELWSIIGNSKLTRFIPKKIVKHILKNIVLKNAYERGFFTNNEVGGQLFMIAKKI